MVTLLPVLTWDLIYFIVTLPIEASQFWDNLNQLGSFIKPLYAYIASLVQSQIKHGQVHHQHCHPVHTNTFQLAVDMLTTETTQPPLLDIVGMREKYPYSHTTATSSTNLMSPVMAPILKWYHNNPYTIISHSLWQWATTMLYHQSLTTYSQYFSLTNLFTQMKLVQLW